MPIAPRDLRIQIYPAPVLRAKAKPVPEITDEIRATATRMIEMMYEAEGIGLAAPQVGLSWRMFVAHVPENDERTAGGELPSANKEPEVYINPVLTQPTGSVEPYEEGCLSLPEIRGNVSRPPTITITATGLDGRSFSRTATGLLARCWQHELDHLDGILIIDRMSQLAKLKNKGAIRDLERDAAKK